LEKNNSQILSITTAPLCAYIVLRSRTITRVYARLLVLLLAGSTGVDVFTQWVLDPVFLLPIMCIFRNSPLLNIPVSAGVCVGLLQSMIALGGPLYFSLFIYRHQV
ncbi:hypothetical protein PENTCL1PPCAC_15736, partial [Pristionchus entomophagus]